MESKLFEYFRNHTKYDNIYNVLLERERDTEDRFAIFVDRNKVRKALHVGDTQFSHKNDSVSSKLFLDIMQSVRSWLEELLEHYRVLYYSGQLDIIVAYTLSLNMYNALQFSAAEEYRNASRWPWYVDGQLAGYVKTAGKFTEVLVRNAGHSVPIDQPAWALDLITTFTRDKCLNRQNSHQ
jgi:vitellogenic carboxypeptidase-like protein